MSTSNEISASTDRAPADDRIRAAVREARTQAAVAVAIVGALLLALAIVDSWQDWTLLGAPWWTWLFLAIPEAALLIALLAWGSGDVHPGRRREAIVVLLGFLALASLGGTVLLVAALVGSSTDDLSAGNLLVHAVVVWITNMIVFSLLFWELDAGGPVRRATVGRAMLEKRLRQVAAMQRAGVHILAGTDAPLRNSPPGFGLHEELTLLTRGGMSPFEALQSATLEPARYFGMLDSLGTIAAGKVADLLLLDANPLQDIRNTRRIAAVVANGRLYAGTKRERLLHIANASP